MIKELKGEITKKFGTISNFCRIADVDRYMVQKLFAAKKNKRLKEHQKELIEDLSNICSRTKNVDTDKHLTLEERIWIKQEVSSYGGVKKFCAKHPFSTVSIHDIIAGRRKLKSNKVKQLIIYLNCLKSST